MGSRYHPNNNKSSTAKDTSKRNITAKPPHPPPPPIPKITRRPPSSLSSVSVHSNESSILSAARKAKAKAKPPPAAPPSAQSRQAVVNKTPTTNLRPAIYYSSTSSPLGLSAGTSRPPLRPRLSQYSNNHNANPLTLARPTIASIAKMPPGDHSSNSRARPGPQLSAAAARGHNRMPLTPKVASPALSTSKGSTTGTPLAGKRQSATLVTGTSTPTPAQEDLPGAIAALLGSNITPRSGKRQGRVDSFNATPDDTLSLERSTEALDETTRGVSNLSFESRPSPTPDSPESERDSKFFYASDAKGREPAQHRPVSVPQKPATFFYANVSSSTNKRKTTPPTNNSAPTLAPPDALGAKFFYANGTSDSSPVRQMMPASGSASTVSSTSRAPTARPSTSQSMSSHPAQRPLSPVKPMSVQTGPVLKGGILSPGPPIRPPLTSSPSIGAPSATTSKRRVSIDAAPRVFQRGHSRTGSVPNVEPLKAPPYASPTRMSPEPISPPTSPGLSNPAMTMATILQAAEDFSDDETASRQGDLPPEPHSPAKSAHDLDGVNELVANARRERKVQDLEITNASLEAINRTLEKQLRKQTAELRRYKRLSRSGKLSIASSRVTSAAHDETSIKLSELIEDEEETEEEEEDLEDSMYDSDPSSEEGSDDGTKALKRRKRDENRLRLDLTKHQELLIDSQKINQSIKRCLDWTEVLIRDGQKALAHNVKPSDVSFGGRVLGPTDEDDELSKFMDEASRLDDGSEASSLVDSPLSEPDPKIVDRDSGVDLQHQPAES